jgi:hypothetical protein
MIRAFLKSIVFLSLFTLNIGLLEGQSFHFPWLNQELISEQDRIRDIPVPLGFQRVQLDSGSFGDWLRNLLLKPATARVHLFNGRLKSNQNVHYRVLDLDVGTQDLQQCADAIIRLWAEYLFGRGQCDQIHFCFTSGDTVRYSDWLAGQRPLVRGNRVEWFHDEPVENNYRSFRNYLKIVFSYASSYSLSREMNPVAEMENVRIGDIYIQGGFPGHAVIIVDLAESVDGRLKAVLLAQSYMPAQDLHVLRNWRNQEWSPWYIIGDAEELDTPEWTFRWSDLRRF